MIKHVLAGLLAFGALNAFGGGYYVSQQEYAGPIEVRPSVCAPVSTMQRTLDLHRGTIWLDSSATTISDQVTMALPRVVDERA